MTIKAACNDDINFSAPGGDFQSVLDDDMVPFEQVGRGAEAVSSFSLNKLVKNSVIYQYAMYSVQGVQKRNIQAHKI